jgi:hypothetical protein
MMKPRGLNMRILMLATAILGLCACATASEPAQRSAQAQREYDHLLAGKIAGTAQKCLPTYLSNDMTIVDDNTILFRNGRTVYVNHPLGGCNNLSQGGRALVTRNFGPQLCRGDLATVVDNTSGMSVGACSLGDFIPYKPS